MVECIDDEHACSVVLPLNKKTAQQGGFFEGSLSSNSLNHGNWLLEGAVTKFVRSV